MNQVLGIIQVIGTFISVGTLMILGIKYMVGSVEERASYKKSMLPYVIGSVLIFSAVNITNVVYDVVESTTNKQEYDEYEHWTTLDAYKGAYALGKRDGNNYAQRGDRSGYEDELAKAKQKYEDAQKDENSDEAEKQGAKGYYDGLIAGWGEFFTRF